ncbi:cytochrome P450 monooxygenase 52A6 [Fusarium sp. NRRL 52700]|nr:cytochrome P450 monooxygenase 52A6 [Fusarium sp. NRRL 52700]
MNSLLVLGLWAAGFCIVFNIANSCWSHPQYDAEGGLNSYQRAPHMPGKYPFPVNFFFAAVYADKEKKLSEIMAPRCGKMRRAGAFEHYTLGNYQ